ncbi:flagellar biosynthesis protein FlgB [Paenibacillus sp. 32O-W]|uniref:flagellar basal body rod protein FlgB n=1 Tax=Paenibacillus sp. 32O-W TaxID=1695218 RepID=UPI00071F46D4|nr:flagellar basal body rod protein FlgB [Paenibacillus sp. 32O-W]ALS27542.1 flagellar biosynthesis protein FlgB [Paenibacillus sp. 32O-W]
MNLLNGAEFRRLETAILAAGQRQQVISNNLANVDTPYFKRSDVLFEELLEEVIKEGANPIVGRRTESRHLPIGHDVAVPQPLIVTDETSVMNNNLNNVDMDREASLMAKNQLLYNAYVQQVNHEIRMLRVGIDGRV